MTPPRTYFDSNQRPLDDPWARLGLDPDASLDEVEARYRELVRDHPPERDPVGFERVSSAYRLLTEDPIRREYGWLEEIDLAELDLPQDQADLGPPLGLAEEVLLYALAHELPWR